MKKKKMQDQLLLLEDIVNLGRKGEIVRAKPGFAWNFLLPQKKAVIADKRTIRLQTRLREERAKQAAEDEKESVALAKKIKDKLFVISVKTDTIGHLYGSVTPVTLAKLFEEEGIAIDRRSIILSKPIKKIGVYDIRLSLKEGVEATCKLKVKSDTPIKEPPKAVEVVDEEEESKKAASEEEGNALQEEIPSIDQKEEEIREEIEDRTEK